MPRTPFRFPLAAGVALLATLALAGCTSANDTAKATATAIASDTSATTEPVESPVPAPAEAAEATAAPVGGDGGQCDIDTPGAKAIVVQGSVDCGTLDSVWARAVADPNFATHGNRNTIVVDNWTCRAHQVAPISTGFCEDAGHRNKFKIVRNG